MKAANNLPNTAARGRTTGAHLLRRAPAAPRCTIGHGDDPCMTDDLWLMPEASDVAPPSGLSADIEDDGSDSGVPRVLLVDKDSDSADALSALLQPEAYVVHAATLAEAQNLLKRDIFALVVIDPILPDGNAASLMPLIIATPVLVYALREPVWREGVAAFLPKPWTSQRRLWSTISGLLGVPTNMTAGD